MIKKEKGITLIALVVTMVLIIIVSAVSIVVGVGNEKETKARAQKAELQMVQHAILERYTKSQFTKEPLPGEHLELQELENIINEINSKAKIGINLKDNEISDYYRLNSNHLKMLKIQNASDTYIVNYKTGEVLNASKKVDKNKEALYVYSASYIGGSYL